MFRVYRHSTGKKSAKAKKLMPLRKGIANIHVRTQVAADVNSRFMQQMATLHDDRPLRDLLHEITRPHIQNSRNVCALDIIGKDRELLQAIADPLFSIEGITNKQLRKKPHQSLWAKNGTDSQLSARVSRHLRLLRDHGLIRKVPSQRKYLFTAQGQTLVAALNALLAASTQKLVAMAA